jgi:tetratricopeptide (TPR) repeat protein
MKDSASTAVFRRDIFFYPALFAVWALFVTVQHYHTSNFGTPLPSVASGEQMNQAFYQQKVIDKSIGELQQSLGEEKKGDERGHIQHNLGTAYYDQYRATQRPDYLDSARDYYQRSIATLPNVARFYYNLGRVFTEQRDHLRAKANYEHALKLEPNHVLALHNLALLNFYELGDRATARTLLEKALAIRADLPICNYVLGEIALQENDFNKALAYFRRETELFALRMSAGRNVPVSESATHFAAARAYLQLAVLYSTKFIDVNYAQANLHAYLRLEEDPAKRNSAIEELKKYWVMK